MANASASTHFSQSDIVTLKVGENKTVFRAHRDLLCSKSKFFEGCLGKGFSEAVKNNILLKEDAPIPVAAFLDWAYQHTFAAVSNMKGMEPSDLTSIYCFADKVCSEPYQNGLMDAIRESCKEGNIYPTDVVIPLSDAGLVESQLVKFIIDGWAYDMVKSPQRYIDGHIKDAIDCWTVHPEIISALLRAIWGYQKELPSETPMTVTGCHYHIHAEGSKCSAPSKECASRF